jgi:hypothetical protein
MTDAPAFLTYSGPIATIMLNRPERFNAMGGGGHARASRPRA